MEIKNAEITGTFLGIEDHGLLTAFLYLNYGDGSQGFGGYNLGRDSPRGSRFISRVLEVVGVLKWSDLNGKTIRVKTTDDKVLEIGHIIKDKWFNPSIEFNDMENNGGENE